MEGKSSAGTALDGPEDGSGMGNYSYAQLEGLWIEAGGSPAKAPLMAAIAMAESRGNSRARNPSGASGLWQILGAPEGWTGSTNWFDPLTNAKAAVAKEETQGLGAWATYTSGAYRMFLRNNVTPANMAQLTAAGGGGTPPIWETILGDLTNPANATQNATNSAGLLGGVTGALHVFGDLSSGAWWARVGKGAIGGGLVLAGVYLAMHKEGYHPVRDVVKAGGKVAEVAAK